MANTRRDFLRTSACALGGMALASSLDTFGVVHALTPQAAPDYRALVCVFLNGGNDGNNTFLDLNQYSQYSTARNAAQLAIPQANFLSVAPLAEVPLASTRTSGDAEPLQSGKTGGAL